MTRLVAPLLLCLGCTGVISDPGQAASGPDSDPPQVCDPTQLAIPGTSQVVRLDHQQYERTVAHLLHLSDYDAARGFTPDAASSVEELRVDSRLALDYRRIAEDAAAIVAGDGALRGQIVPCDEADFEVCARLFVEELGQRAFRRPLEAREVEAYLARFELAPTLYEDGEPFARGVELVVQAFLQAPSFLYRVERSEPDGDDPAALDGYELASRLSYTLWNTLPDEELLAAAAAGELDSPEQLLVQAQRMVDDPRAEEVVLQFHRELIEVDRFEDLHRDGSLHPAWHDGLAGSMRAELDRFVQHVVFEEGGGIDELLTAPYTFVDADLAAIYGFEGDFGSELVRVDTDPDQRIGLLTQVGFLSSNANFDSTDPIHRGLFVQRKLLCADLGTPAAGAAAALGPLVTTQRQRVEDGTMTPGTVCAGCHAAINPPGFALEHYGALGEYRTEENGYAVDSSTELRIDGELVTLDGPRQLAEAVANSEATHRCYASQWFQFTYGRDPTPAERCTIDRLGVELHEGATVRDLLLALTQTPAFTARTDVREEP